MHMSAPIHLNNNASQTGQMSLKNYLQERINSLNIRSKESLISTATQAKLTEILNGSGYEVKQVHWHKKNGSETNRWAELCDGHHHKPTQSTAPVSQAHDPAQQALHRCEGPHCATTPEKKTPFWNQVLGLFQAA
jgi:hypothetical protein